MVESSRREISSLELAFFGSVCASLSHEINNVMAIIGELNGLLEDITAARGADSSPDTARMKSAIERVSAQIQRGADYVKQLNAFSHSVDGRDAALDSLAVLKSSLQLSGRFAKLKKVRLELVDSGESPQLRGSAFGLHHIFIRAIRAALLGTEEGSSIDIGLSSRDEGAVLVLSSSRMDPRKLEGSDDAACLEELLGCIGGGVRTEIPGSSACSLIIDVPKNVNPPACGQETPAAAP